MEVCANTAPLQYALAGVWAPRADGYGRKRSSVRAWRWICDVKPTPKASNKPLHHCIVHGLDNSP